MNPQNEQAKTAGHLVAVVAVLQRPDGKIALGLRVEEGVWAGFGGKLEPGESAESGLRREVLEEAGVMLDAVTPLTFRAAAKADGTPFVVLYYLARLPAGTASRVAVLEPRVFSQLAWFDPQELPDNVWEREREVLRLVPAGGAA